ncbi:MAG TPA: AAA family ATPase, partial [Pseudosphingobacterium sp.]|nr:AAA family ATPase [Pseudosphingobacterium sp.]
SIVDSSKNFEQKASKIQETTRLEYVVLEQNVKQYIEDWRARENKAIQIIEEKKKELFDQNIPLDLLYIQKLADQEAKYIADLKILNSWKPQLELLRKSYKVAIKKLWDIRSRISMTRIVYAKEASSTLKSVLTDLMVNLKFAEGSYSPTAEEIIKQAMSWKTHHVARANMLISQLSLKGLLDAVEKKDISAVMEVKTKEGILVFDKNEADRIITTLSDQKIKFDLEVCEIFDLPNLIVTKAVPSATGKPNYVNRDFSKLSLGQQQSVLLALLLSSKSNAPLIIDQPEDNLDGEFIYHSLVPVLRLAKERRQIIIVTHNANIAILGDAEQILILKSTNDKCIISARGSIDNEETKEIACNILEGAREAFKRRAKIYGSI